MRSKAEAEAKGQEAKALALEMQGMAEAKVLREKSLVEAGRIQAEAEAMKALDQASRLLQEFTMRLNAEKEITLSRIDMQKELAKAQADVLAAAMKNARIDIIGGEHTFFEKITGALSNGKAVDAYVNGSEVLTALKTNLLGSSEENVIQKVKGFVQQFGLSPQDIKDLTLSALLARLSGMGGKPEMQKILKDLTKAVSDAGLEQATVKQLGIL